MPMFCNWKELPGGQPASRHHPALHGRLTISGVVKAAGFGGTSGTCFNMPTSPNHQQTLEEWRHGKNTRSKVSINAKSQQTTASGNNFSVLQSIFIGGRSYQISLVSWVETTGDVLIRRCSNVHRPFRGSCQVPQYHYYQYAL